MPIYEFSCNECKYQYEFLSKYDETEEYPSVSCPKCQSKVKKKVPSICSFAFAQVEGTSRMERFDYRAGHYMNKAQAERRAAEEFSHVGANPYTTHLDDTSYGEGITHLDE